MTVDMSEGCTVGGCSSFGTPGLGVDVMSVVVCGAYSAVRGLSYYVVSAVKHRTE